MKKIVVVDIEYMKPSVGGRSRSRSRSQSRSRSTGAGAAARSRSRSFTRPIEQSSLCDEYDDNDDNESEDTNDASDDIYESEAGETSSDSSSYNLRQHPSITDSDYAVNSDDDILQSVLDEPTFPLDVNAILSAMTKTENSTIANMTLNKIAARRHEVLSSMNLTPEKMAEFERKLQMYRVIETPDELKHNQLIRWIPLRSLETRPYVTLGGCLFRVRYNEEESLHIVTIRNVKRFVFNIKFELNAVFQRLSQEELLILHAVEYIEAPE
jgi:hypothetical protein